VHAIIGKSLQTFLFYTTARNPNSTTYFFNFFCSKHSKTPHISLNFSDRRPNSLTTKSLSSHTLKMSNTQESSPVNTHTNSSPSENPENCTKAKHESFDIITQAIPITTIHPQISKKKKTKTSTTVPKPSSAARKSNRSKTKKGSSSTTVRRVHTMESLYLEDLNPSNVETNVDTSEKVPVGSDVETTTNIAAETQKAVEDEDTALKITHQSTEKTDEETTDVSPSKEKSDILADLNKIEILAHTVDRCCTQCYNTCSSNTDSKAQ
jgi:hypothetical protein